MFVIGHRPSQKERERMSARLALRWKDPAYRQRMSQLLTRLWKDSAYRKKVLAARRGRICTAETRVKLSQSTASRWQDPAYREKMCSSLRGNKGRRGQQFSDETKRKMSLASRGRVFSKEARKRMSESAKNKWRDPEKARKLFLSVNPKPNKAERLLMGLLERIAPNQWRYVGDGSLIIGGKCPDFANINGQKKLIELFGDYWHRGEDPAERAACFAPFGYETLVLWEHELRYPAAVEAKIKEFSGLVEES